MALNRNGTRATPSSKPSNPKTAVSDGSKRSFKTSIDFKPDVRAKLVALLNQNLADVTDLHSQTKQAHWNVKGTNFYQLHELFDDLAESIFGFIDEIAERATALGGYATGTACMAATNSRVPEFPTQATNGLDHLHALIERYAAYAKSARAAMAEADRLGDTDTNDLFTDVSRAVDKALWFLEAHVQG